MEFRYIIAAPASYLNTNNSSILLLHKLHKVMEEIMLRPPNDKNSRLAIRRSNPCSLATAVNLPRPDMRIHLTLTREINLHTHTTRVQDWRNIKVRTKEEALVADCLCLGVIRVVDDRHTQDRPAKFLALGIEDSAAVLA